MQLRVGLGAQAPLDFVPIEGRGRSRPGEVKDGWILIQSNNQGRRAIGIWGGSRSAAPTAAATHGQGQGEEYGFWPSDAHKGSVGGKGLSHDFLTR
jgi:hypothetical protein